MNILAALVITLIGPVVGQGDEQSYSNVPNDAEIAPLNIEHTGTSASVRLGEVLCIGTLPALDCSDGTWAIVTLQEQHFVMTGGRGKPLRKFWRLNGGTIERP